MKMQSTHFNQLQIAISKAYDLYADQLRGLGKKDPALRFRWDLLHCCTRLGLLPITWVCDELYPYLNDDHIDTALRRIVKQLEAN